METARIAALLEPFLARPLSQAQLDQTSTYIDLLLRWNARVNLTAIRHPEEIVARHFGESFFLARHVFPDCVEWTARASPASVIDLGSGAGFPGLPLKIWAPQIQLALIESNHKKAAFLREVCRALTLTGVNVIAERAEAVADRLTGSHVDVPRADVPPVDAALADLVTFRAVERFDQILPVALRFLVPRGRLALLISSDQLPRVKTDPPMRWAAINIPQSHKRILCLGDRASWII